MGDVVTKEQFFTARKPKMFTVELPDMGVTVNVLKGTMGTLRKIQEYAQQENAAVKQCALVLCDSDGNLIIDSEQALADAVERLSLDDTKAIMSRYLKENGIDDESQEQTLKNSEASLNGVSVSA